MNNITRTLTAILANTALVWGWCEQEPDANGLVILDATWTKVPVQAFLVCAKLKKVVIPQGVTEFLNSAFYESGLEVIEFDAGSKLETIDNYAFKKCVKLKKVVIPQGVKEILYGAFDSSGLKVIEFEVNSQLEIIDEYAFSGTSIVSIVIPQGVTSFDANKVFGGTPCDDKNVFKPGNTVVNCEIITPTPSPTTMVPTTAAPTTAAPTTSAPTTMAPTTAAPTAAVPTTTVPTEGKDACVNLQKRKCRNTCVFSKRQRQCLPKSTSFEHDCAQYEGKTPCLENKVCKFPHGKCVHRCDGKNARRCRKHKFCNLDKVVNPCFGCHLVTACGPRR